MRWNQLQRTNLLPIGLELQCHQPVLLAMLAGQRGHNHDHHHNHHNHHDDKEGVKHYNHVRDQGDVCCQLIKGILGIRGATTCWQQQ
jgi:hypothetical protein